MRNFLLILVVILSGHAGYSQDSDKDTEKAAKKEAKAAEKAQKVAEGRSLITPIAAPGYTPELGALIAVGGLWSFNPQKKKYVDMQRSSMPFTVAYTSTNAIVINGILTSYWFDDKLRINGDFWYKDMPDHYWGVGDVKAETVPKSDTTTAYQREWFWINPRFLYQFKKNYFLGLNVDLNSTQGSDPSAGVAADEVYQKYVDRPFNAGIGPILRYDSRDIPVNAYGGWLLDLRATWYGDYLGGDNNYAIYSFDYRRYERVGQVGQNIAFMLKGRFGLGDVPFGEMSQLGTPFDLRGYQWGRFRDKSMFMAIVEYRHKFYHHTTGEPTKHGMVTWVGTGSVFDIEDNTDNADTFLPNFGVGYRLEVQPRMDLRLDIGIGRETSGFYFNFNQAF